MTYRLWSLVAIVAASGALLAGCGSSSSSSSSSTAAPAAKASTSSASTATSAATATGTSTGSSSTGAGASTSTGASGAAAVASNPAVKAAVAQCKTAINSAPQLSAASKAKLDSLCDKAASGKLTDLKSVTYDVCKQVIKDSVPAAEQQTALASCPKP
jgi:hypothetical protein